MKRFSVVALILLIPTLMLFAFERFLDREAPRVSPFSDASVSVDVPAAPGARFPFLDTSTEGQVYLSWLEPAEDGAYALRMSHLLKDRWTRPSTIAQGTNWFVNWADFPSLNIGEGGAMAAHWLAYRAEGKYDYDIRISLSRDSGATWSGPLTPHRDGVAAEHGFVSMVPWRGGFSVFWLDGRHTVETPRHPMSLRHAFLQPTGELSEEVELDDSVCDCCQTSAALAEEGPIVAYRNRSTEEIRDIYVIRNRSGQWSAPSQVAEDGWRIEGCPVNGPAIAAREGTVAVGWFTQAADQPRVLLAFSKDGGDNFSKPLRVDAGDPYGRVDVLLNRDGSAWVSWLEASEGDGVDVRLRKFASTGPLGAPIIAGRTSASRSSGFPRMTAYGGNLILAWTEPGEPGHIRTAWIR